MKIHFKKYMGEGFEYPKFYGVAYFIQREHAAVCFPIPFNYVVAFWRWLWYAIKYPKYFIEDGIGTG